MADGVYSKFISSVTQHTLVINIRNSVTCFGSLSHHQAKYKPKYWYIQWVPDDGSISRNTWPNF